MPGPAVTIVDYQMGNLRSVQKALEHGGVEAVVTSDPVEIARANRLILPGVGAFGDAIRELRQRQMVNPIMDFVASGRPFLGICLGLQLLFEVGEENGEHQGLGILKGRVQRFDIDPSLKVPHMGWNSVVNQQPSVPLLEGISASPQFYFVHSYYAKPEDSRVVWLSCEYGVSFAAAVAFGNVMATQFHPEKSQRDGLQLLKNFSHLPITSLSDAAA